MSRLFFAFHGCRENPFAANLDPRFLLETPDAERAFSQITQGVREHAGLMVLTGEAGTGKTTLVYRLLDSLRLSETPTAFVCNSRLDVEDLWRLMLAEFGAPRLSEPMNGRLERFREWLANEYHRRRTPVLIIDEAQGLSVRVLEELRILAGLMEPGRYGLQIILSGQPELDETLTIREMRAISQRIAVRCRMRALDFEQVAAYVRSRLTVAGADNGEIFERAAMRAVYRYSQGIPRLINLICEHALIEAYAAKKAAVDEAIVARIAQEFDLEAMKGIIEESLPPRVATMPLPWMAPPLATPAPTELYAASSAPSFAKPLPEVVQLAGAPVPNHPVIEITAATLLPEKQIVPNRAPAASASLPEEPRKVVAMKTPSRQRAEAARKWLAMQNEAVRKWASDVALPALIVWKQEAMATAASSRVKARERTARAAAGYKALANTVYIDRVRRGRDRVQQRVSDAKHSIRGAARGAAPRMKAWTENRIPTTRDFLHHMWLSVERHWGPNLDRLSEYLMSRATSSRWMSRYVEARRAHRGTLEAVVRWLRQPLPF